MSKLQEEVHSSFKLKLNVSSYQASGAAARRIQDWINALCVGSPSLVALNAHDMALLEGCMTTIWNQHHGQFPSIEFNLEKLSNGNWSLRFKLHYH